MTWPSSDSGSTDAGASVAGASDAADGASVMAGSLAGAWVAGAGFAPPPPVQAAASRATAPIMDVRPRSDMQLLLQPVAHSCSVPGDRTATVCRVSARAGVNAARRFDPRGEWPAPRSADELAEGRRQPQLGRRGENARCRIDHRVAVRLDGVPRAVSQAGHGDPRRPLTRDRHVHDLDPGAQDLLQVDGQPLRQPALGVVHALSSWFPTCSDAGAGSSPASSRRKPSASSTATPSSVAFASLEPAPGPATR